jgi:phosphoglycolate phosphatase-like HAD superfamily hydrolase
MTHKNQKPILLFDWDGVIVNSNDWKWRDMWPDLFFDYPEYAKKAQEILRESEGRHVSRRELLRQVLASDDASAAPAPITIEEALQRYSKTSMEGVSRLGFFEGTREVLEDLHGLGFTMYVITGTLHDDIQHIARDLGVAHLFKALYGTRPSALKRKGAIKKYDAFEEIARDEGVNDPVAYIVIGDGASDKELAEQIGCKFIGVKNEWNGWGDNESFSTINGISEILQVLKLKC